MFSEKGTIFIKVVNLFTVTNDFINKFKTGLLNKLESCIKNSTKVSDKKDSISI